MLSPIALLLFCVLAVANAKIYGGYISECRSAEEQPAAVENMRQALKKPMYLDIQDEWNIPYDWKGNYMHYFQAGPSEPATFEFGNITTQCERLSDPFAFVDHVSKMSLTLTDLSMHYSGTYKVRITPFASTRVIKEARGTFQGNAQNDKIDTYMMLMTDYNSGAISSKNMYNAGWSTQKTYFTPSLNETRGEDMATGALLNDANICVFGRDNLPYGHKLGDIIAQSFVKPQFVPNPFWQSLADNTLALRLSINEQLSKPFGVVIPSYAMAGYWDHLVSFSLPSTASVDVTFTMPRYGRITLDGLLFRMTGKVGGANGTVVRWEVKDIPFKVSTPFKVRGDKPGISVAIDHLDGLDFTESMFSHVTGASREYFPKEAYWWLSNRAGGITGGYLGRMNAAIQAALNQ